MSENPEPAPGGAPSKNRRLIDILILLGIPALWVVLQLWVLPSAGVST